MQEIKDIATRVQQKRQVSPSEVVSYLRNDPEAISAFMVANNPGSVHAILKSMGYNRLGFEPKMSTLAQQLQTFIDTGNWADLNEVISRFSLKTEDLNPEFTRSFNKTFKA